MSLSKTQIILKARQITGNKPGRSAAETDVPDEAVDLDFNVAIQDLSEAIGAGGATAMKDKIFTATSGVQDYLITTYVGSDVYRIEEVLRSGAFSSNYTFADSANGDGFNTPSQAIIHPGLQSDFFNTVNGMSRSDRIDRFGGWEQAPGGLLRLMPPPEGAEVIAVRYLTSGADLDGLPDSAEQALVFAVVVSMLNGAINRIGQDKVSREVQNSSTTDHRIKILEKQRDYYQGRYDSAAANVRP